MADALVNPAAAIRAQARARATAAPPSPIENYAVSTVLCLLMATLFVTLGPGARHWFIVPTTLAGILAGSDVIVWLRRRCDAFDPKALAGLVLFQTAFLAPMVHMALEAHDPQFASIGDWGRWFGILGLFHILGICCYKAAQAYTFRYVRPAQTCWMIDPGRFTPLILGAIGISGIFAAIVLARFGGLAKEAEGVSIGVLPQLSWILMFSDPFPFLVMMGVTAFLARNPRPRTLAFVLTLLAAFLVAQFLLLGLRGSRSSIIFGLFMATLIVHYRLRRIPVPIVLVALGFIFVGGYFYKFYKRAGTVGAQTALAGQEERERLERATGINPLGVLLGDLARANVQAFALFRIFEFPERYELRWGRTYLSAATVIIPRAIWKDKPLVRGAALTDLFYGEGTYAGGTIRSSRILGLLGEAILNFGALGIPVMFIAYGLFTGWYRKKLLSFASIDGRFFIIPMITLAVTITPFSDSDLIAFGFLKNGAVPILVVLLSTTRVPRAALTPTPLTAAGSRQPFAGR